jgi:hypothetical protein
MVCGLVVGASLATALPEVRGTLLAALVGDWAGRRVLDTLLGCTIALLASYLLWPRDRETEETVPVAS